MSIMDDLIAEHEVEIVKRDAGLLGLLHEAVDEMGSLISMMEPYYSQCDADKGARELMARIKQVLPASPKPAEPSAIYCDLCQGAKAKRIFKNHAALKHHKQDAHTMQEQAHDH